MRKGGAWQQRAKTFPLTSSYAKMTAIVKTKKEK